MIAFRFGIFSLVGASFTLLLLNTLYVAHEPHTNVSVTCPAEIGVTHCTPPTTASTRPALQIPANGTDTMVVDIRQSAFDLGSKKFARQVRIVPLLTNGVPSGFKLYAIRPGSLASMIGLENGDTVIALNDMPVVRASSHITSSLEKLTKPGLLDIELKRRGQPLRILVVVHEDNAT